MDKVFLLSDVDEFYDQLEKIFKGNQTDVQGRWVVSNPCFEIWLYYCYLDSPEKVLGCLKTEPITTRSKKMKALGNTLVSGGLNPCLAFENMLNGIEHCIAYYAEDDNRITVLFPTRRSSDLGSVPLVSIKEISTIFHFYIILHTIMRI